MKNYKYQYHIIDISKLELKLNELGQQGWRFCVLEKGSVGKYFVLMEMEDNAEVETTPSPPPWVGKKKKKNGSNRQAP